MMRVSTTRHGSQVEQTRAHSVSRRGPEVTIYIDDQVGIVARVDGHPSANAGRHNRGVCCDFIGPRV